MTSTLDDARDERITAAEIQSGMDRQQWAENLIQQLPMQHDGRNSWLLNYGRREEARAMRNARGLTFNEQSQAINPPAARAAPVPQCGAALIAEEFYKTIPEEKGMLRGNAKGFGLVIAEAIRAAAPPSRFDAGSTNPFTTEQLHALQFGRLLHERPNDLTEKIARIDTLLKREDDDSGYSAFVFMRKLWPQIKAALVAETPLQAIDQRVVALAENAPMPLQDKTAEKMLNNVADFIAATLAKPDQRAWDQLLIYCPRESLEQRLAALSPDQGTVAVASADREGESTDHIDWDILAEERLGQRPRSEHGRHIPQTSPAPGCDSGSHSDTSAQSGGPDAT